MADQLKVKGSEHYVWFKDKELGRGATGYVYEGKHRKTGVSFAVKVPNPDTRHKYKDAIEKEIKYLKRLQSHENIVQFVAIEKEKYQQIDCVIMELCTGGSLHNILEDPDNYYGLPEDELLLVLACLARGLYHLYCHGIVHRDVKPGNILMTITPDGRHVYKFSDFGAATEATDENGFESLWGTEEYMDPSMHMQALHHRTRPQRTFGPSVDLWSIGVTLYQCATGELPYKPSLGVRKNRSKMQELISERDSWVISQVEGKDGEIQRHDDLPKWCSLPRGLRDFLVPLIAKLETRDPEKRPNIEDFYDEVENFLSKDKVFVFNSISCEHLTVYLAKAKGLTHIQEALAHQTGIIAEHQQLVYNQQPLDTYLTYSGGRGRLPHTSQLKPILLLTHNNYYDDMSMYNMHIPELNLQSDGTLHQDFKLITEHSARIRYYERAIDHKHLTQQHLLDGLDYARRDLATANEHNQITLSTYISFLKDILAPIWNKNLEIIYRNIGDDQPELNRKTAKMSIYMDGLNGKSATLMDPCTKTTSRLRNGAWDYDKGNACSMDKRCVYIIKRLWSEINKIYLQFRDDKRSHPGYNDMEIHRFNMYSLHISYN